MERGGPKIEIRRLEPRDVERVVELSIRAWEPVFVSIRDTIEPELYGEFYPDGWETSQRNAVREVCTGGEHEVWVAVEENRPVGFVAVKYRRDEDLGEIHMIAVDPGHQGRGVGGALTEKAMEEIKRAGFPIAMVETGGDPGHAPARRLYEGRGFREFPTARYFKKL